MSAPLVVPSLPRAQMPADYNQVVMEQAFQAVEEELAGLFSRKSDLVLEPGKKLVLSGLVTNKPFAIAVSASDTLVLVDYETGVATDFILAAEQISFGEQTIFDQSSETFISTTGTIKARYGTAFGADSDVVLWHGPVGVANGAETPENGYLALAEDGLYINGAAAGWGANASEAAASNALVPVGGNLLVDTDFKRGTKFWDAGGWKSFANSVVSGQNFPGPYYGAHRNVAYAYVPDTPPVGVFTVATQFAVADLVARFSVTPGERLYFRMLGTVHRAAKIAIHVIWMESDGAYGPVGDQEVGYTTHQDGGYNGEDFGLAEGYVTVPDGAAFASAFVRVTTNGAATPFGFFCEPMAARVPSWQVASNVPYIPGRPDPLGDKTEESIPANLSLNLSATLDPVYPLSSTASSISIAATTVSWPHNTLALPAATISGLTDDTSYAVFYDMDNGTYLAVASSATTYYTSVGRYLALGTQRTTLSGGGYSPPPPPPSGGGGGSYPGLPSIP